MKPSSGDPVALLEDHLAAAGGFHRHLAGVIVEADGLTAHDGDLAHLSGHQRRVRGHAAECGQEPDGSVHAADVLGRGLVPAKNDRLAPGGPGLGVVGEEDHLAGGGARTGGQTLGQDALLLVGLNLCRRIEDRPQQLIERLRLHAADGLFLGDQFLLHHLHGDAHAGEASPLAAAALQHVQLGALDGELHVLHVAVVLLKLLADVQQLLVGLGEGLLQLHDLLRGADAGHHVLALGVDQELAVEEVLAAGGIAREADAGGRIVALVAEHHGLDVDRGAPGRRDAVQLAVGVGAVIFPRIEDGHDGALELLVRVGREIGAHALLDLRLELLHQLLQRARRKIGVVLGAGGLLLLGQQHLEGVVVFLALGLHPQHHVPVHGHEAAVAVVGEALVSRGDRQPGRGFVIQAQVQDGVHHARHGRPRSRADRHQQGILGVAELGAHQLLHPGNGGAHVVLQTLGQAAAGLVELGADLGGDGESGGTGHANVGHLGEIRALATEEILHLLVALRLAAAEEIEPFPPWRPWCCAFGLAPSNSRNRPAWRWPR